MGGGAGGVVEEGWWRVAGFAFGELGHGYIFGGVVVSWWCERECWMLRLRKMQVEGQLSKVMQLPD